MSRNDIVKVDGSINYDYLGESIDGLSSQMADNAISPDFFYGTDTEKVQQALDYAIINYKAIRFSRMFDITGSTLLINKINADRKVLYLLGVGGGIKKIDVGYIFTSPNGLSGDIVSSTMKYESINGIGTKCWDGNTLIRVNSNNDCYTDVDQILEANSTYAQTMKFSKCTITGGSGWAFEWKKSFDVQLEGNLIEHRENGIRNSCFTNNPDNNTLRIINNCMEGLTGKAMQLGSSFGVIIKGNYMEANVGGYIDLAESSNYHNGLVIEGNTFQLTQAQINMDEPAIDLKSIGNNGVSSKGNASTGVLYKLYADGTKGRVTSDSDISYTDKKAINKPAQLVEFGKLTSYTDGVGFGRVAIYVLKSDTITFVSGEAKEITITPVDITLNNNNIVSVNLGSVSGNYNVVIDYCRFSTVNNTIYIKVINNSTSSQNIQVMAKVMQIN